MSIRSLTWLVRALSRPQPACGLDVSAAIAQPRSALVLALGQVLARQQSYSYAIDGRFKGGYITRSNGAPDQHIHAVQLEMCWSCYMPEAPPFALNASRVTRLEPVLHALIDTLLAWRPVRANSH